MRRHYPYTVALLVFTFALLPFSLRAQGHALPEADAKELASYRLTMDTFSKVATAMRGAAAQMKQDPRFQKSRKLKAELEALENKEMPTDADIARMEALQQEVDQLEESSELNLASAQSLDELEAGIHNSPILSKSLQQAGLAPREYAKFMMALVQAGFAAGFKKAGMLKELPPGVSPENVKFVEEHEAELKALQEQFAKLESGGD